MNSSGRHQAFVVARNTWVRRRLRQRFRSAAAQFNVLWAQVSGGAKASSRTT